MVHHNIIKRIRLLAVASLLLFASLTPVLFTQDSYAAQITLRSLTLEAGSGGAEGGTPGPTEAVDHTFSFTMPETTGGSEYQSVKFLYCDTADVLETNCTAPSGMTGTDGVDSVSSVSGLSGALTGASVDSSSANEVVLTYGSAQTVGVGGSASTVTFADVNNPDQANYTFFVRIIAYSGTDGTGTVRHAGTVAASTAEPIVLSGVMPESLIFCAGATVEESSPGVPDCSTASAGAINFNDLFSPTATRFSFSQMAASTNAGSGYAVTVNGPTLTSGGNTIPAMAAATTPVVGTGQFGMNLVANTAGGGLDLESASFGAGQVNEAYDGGVDPTEGFDNDDDGGTTPDIFSANVDQTPNGTNLRGQPATDYDTDGTFKFATGDVVANSDNGGAGPSDGQIYTVSYITNVAGSQAPGTYVTTLLYICTPTF